MNIAIIPARSGSKGIPNKNIMKLWGKSLIGWAASCAQSTRIYDEVILSTDSREYAEEGLRHDCKVPFLRSPSLAADNSNIAFAIKEIIDKSPGSESWETITLLEPTCPLRTPQLLKNCFNETKTFKDAHSIVTVSEVITKYHPLKQFRLNQEGQLSFFVEEAKAVVNRQELCKTYIRNGAAYILSVKSFQKSACIVTDSSRPFICNQYLVNIDSQQDIDDLRAFEQTHSSPW